MPLWSLLILALVQGVTEFLPISSSGHLAVLHHWLPHEGGMRAELMLDVAVHVGTLFAVCLYFWRDVWAMLRGVCDTVRLRRTAESSLLGYVIAASLPVIGAGFLMHLYALDFVRQVEVIAWATIVFALVLWWADRKGEARTMSGLRLRDACVIGVAQIFALVPGTSRSGVTMSAARALGFSRVESARFSLLLSMVAISGAGVLALKDLFDADAAALSGDILIAVGAAFVSALLTIFVMMRWLSRFSFMPFIIYRLILGTGLLVAVYAGLL